MRFSVAIDGYNSQTQAKETTWVPMVVFGKQADFTRQYLGRGRAVAVSARYSVREYTDKQGNKRKDGNFIVDRIEPVGPGPDRQPVAAGQQEENGSLW